MSEFVSEIVLNAAKQASEPSTRQFGKWIYEKVCGIEIQTKEAACRQFVLECHTNHARTAMYL